MQDSARLIDEMDTAARRILLNMAAESEVSPEAMLVSVAAEYALLARDAPGALPNSPMRRLAGRAIKAGRK